MCFSSVQKTRLARAARKSARCMRRYLRRRIWQRLKLFHQYLGAPLPVVERFFRLGQRSDGGLGEAALDEPVRGTRGEHEQFPEAELARFDFAVLQQLLAVAASLVPVSYTHLRAHET